MSKSKLQISWKRILASLHDVVMAGVAMALAVTARYGLGELPRDRLGLWVAGFMAVCAVAFRAFGLGRGMWRFASITDLRAIVAASTAAVIVFVLLLFVATRLEEFPRTAPIIAWFALIVLVGAPRLAYRALKDGGLAHARPRDLHASGVEQVLILGSASEADTVIRTYGLENSPRYRVRGIVDYTSSKRGRNVRGVPIVGEVSELEEVVARLGRAGIAIDALIVAAPRDRAVLAPLATTVTTLGLPLRRVAPASLAGGEADLEAITLEDLLGRPPVRLDLQTIRSLIADRVVVVTGAGGSIGSEIVRQVAGYRPERLVLVDSSEYALYQIDLSLAREAPAVRRRAVLADVRDRAGIAALMRNERPAIVFHAAALKHVPLVEANVAAGVATNVIGTRNVADAAVAAGADAVVMISTDKAIRPTSVMGATKRVAEAYCQALDVSGVATRFITVRFGNVLGSTGSVVPLFKRQIGEGGPVTVTHPEMKRYFMTIREATELVLQAAAHGVTRPDQRGRIFVLDMGEPIRIVDLARTMIALAGRRPEADVPIVFTGLRPGEKLFEELFDKDEATEPSGAEGVFVASARFLEVAAVRRLVERLEEAVRAEDADGARALLATLAAELPHDGADREGAEVVPFRTTSAP